MKYYILSDTHHNHKEIAGYCNRPENHEQLIYRGYMDVPSDACLIHLGDFALGGEEDACRKLNQYCIAGRKILVKGNHDSKSYSWYMDHGWDFVCDSFKLKYAGKIIMFSHRPQPWDGDWEINVHGHLHNLGHRDNEYRDLKQWHRLYAPELMNYRPIELADFIQRGAKC